MASSRLQMPDNKNLYFGSGNDSRLYYDGDNTLWDLRATGTGNLLIQNGDVGIATSTPNAKLEVDGDVIIDDSVIVKAEFNPYILDLSEGYHLNGDSIVVYGDTFPTPQVGWTFIDTSGGDTLKCYLNSAWEAK